MGEMWMMGGGVVKSQLVKVKAGTRKSLNVAVS
jgi:hypothetical protein